MFHPTRGGVRGGKDQFTWESVKTDKDRECYLGHSLMAPVGRWQQGKDIIWYANENATDAAARKKQETSDEFRRAKEVEEQALMAALGYRVVPKAATTSPLVAAAVPSAPGPPSSSSRHKEKDSKSKSVKVKREKEAVDDNDEQEETKAKVPSLTDGKSNDELDKMLLKLLNKHGIKQVIAALSEGVGRGEASEDDEKSSRKKSHKKKHKKNKKAKSSSSSKKHHKTSKRHDDTSSSSESDSDEHDADDGKRKKKTSEDPKSSTSTKKLKRSSSNSSSSTDEN